MTPTEAFLIGLLGLVGGVIGAITVLSGKFVSKRECRLAHAKTDEASGRIERQVSRLFNMVRALVVHSNIPDEKKEQILNGRTGE